MNILVIDDEPLILKTVCTQLSEMHLPFERIDTAGSAEEARLRARERSYEIFLCDIVMPEEDGISFVKWALPLFPDAKFIFLTAHADFDYMKEAISMQSFDYVLQPVSREDLQAVIERAIHQLSIEEKNRRLMEKGSFYEDHEAEILEGNSIRYLLGLSQDASFLRELLESVFSGISDDDCYFIYYVQMLSESPILNQNDLSLFRSIFYNVTNETFEPLGLPNALLLRNDRSGDFFGIVKFSVENEPEYSEFLQRLSELRGFFDRLLNLKIAVYAGRISYLEDLPMTVSEIQEELQNNVRKASYVYQAGDLSSLSAGSHSFDQESAVWKSLIQKNRLRDLRDSFFRYLDYHTARGSVNREFMARFHQRASELILGYMVSEDIPSTEVFDEKLSYYDFLYCFDTVSHLKESLDYVFDRLYERVDIPGEETVQKTIRYIRNHIDQEILVTEIAEYVSLNPVYLTRAFKKATGYSLKRFIENEKIEAAKNLLATTDLSISVISGHVGYANYSNFTRSFKLLTGLTPSEYREQNGQKQ